MTFFPRFCKQNSFWSTFSEDSLFLFYIQCHASKNYIFCQIRTRIWLDKIFSQSKGGFGPIFWVFFNKKSFLRWKTLFFSCKTSITFLFSLSYQIDPIPILEKRLIKIWNRIIFIAIDRCLRRNASTFEVGRVGSDVRWAIQIYGTRRRRSSQMSHEDSACSLRFSGKICPWNDWGKGWGHQIANTLWAFLHKLKVRGQLQTWRLPFGRHRIGLNKNNVLEA